MRPRWMPTWYDRLRYERVNRAVAKAAMAFMSELWDPTEPEGVTVPPEFAAMNLTLRYAEMTPAEAQEEVGDPIWAFLNAESEPDPEPEAPSLIVFKVHCTRNGLYETEYDTWGEAKDVADSMDRDADLFVGSDAIAVVRCHHTIEMHRRSGT